MYLTDATLGREDSKTVAVFPEKPVSVAPGDGDVIVIVWATADQVKSMNRIQVERIISFPIEYALNHQKLLPSER